MDKSKSTHLLIKNNTQTILTHNSLEMAYTNYLQYHLLYKLPIKITLKKVRFNTLVLDSCSYPVQF